MKEQSALHSSELAKLSHDPDDPNNDIWELMVLARSLQEQMEEFQEECQKKLNEQMCTLDGLMNWCDSLLYQAGELYSKRSQNKDIPEDQ